jgi:hypothetical protein
MSGELSWFKSSYSGSQGDSCVEVALSRAESGRSGSAGDACVEVAACAEAVHVRDSKVTGGPQLALSSGAWRAFVGLASAARV